MLYYLFNYLDTLDFPGAGMFKYVSFRAAVTILLSLIISTVIGRRIIDKLQVLQIGEIVRNLGLEGQLSKKGTPTMGGVSSRFTVGTSGERIYNIDAYNYCVAGVFRISG